MDGVRGGRDRLEVIVKPPDWSDVKDIIHMGPLSKDIARPWFHGYLIQIHAFHRIGITGGPGPGAVSPGRVPMTNSCCRGGISSRSCLGEALPRGLMGTLLAPCIACSSLFRRVSASSFRQQLQVHGPCALEEGFQTFHNPCTSNSSRTSIPCVFMRTQSNPAGPSGTKG